jgi:Tol biopolymer transport system component
MRFENTSDLRTISDCRARSSSDQACHETQAHPCIALDGSYIIFDVNGGAYMYVSFKSSDGTWREGIDLTQNGFDPLAGGPSISPDGKYLFFALDGDIWWVDIKVIENLRPEA